MGNFSPLTNLILLILAVLLPAFGFLVWFIIDVYKKKWLRLIWAKLSLLLLSMVIGVFITPWVFSNVAVTFSKDKVMCEAMFKLALKTSILSSAKSRMHLYLAHLYFFDHRGQDAINAFEQSYKYKQNEVAVDNLCSLYTIKGQRSYAIAACIVSEHKETAAINSILKDDYEMAYSSINMAINEAKNPSCLAYAIRGQVYRRVGNSGLAEVDFKKAKEMCGNAQNIQDILDNPNYFHEHYAELKKEYNFE